ncbi:MAG: AAA family ATPase [Euryarchaeota archaeon]|nr:AAA family ATPase [Euryarchaeota archaeon]MDE2045530.1 AAA family ATPase [Thermoplasmata archaeon]
MAESAETGPAHALPAAAETLFVGRTRELALLVRALEDAKAGKGSAWVVEGPAGMGKTRLVREVQEESSQRGFRVLSGHCLKEVLTPFFVFQQALRPLQDRGELSPASLPDPLPSLVVFEEDRPARVFEEAALLSARTPCLLVAREPSRRLRARLPALHPSAELLGLSKEERSDQSSPLLMDELGHRLAAHLSARRGSVIAMGGLGYLASQNGFPALLRLIQFLRDSAEESGGHLLLSLNPTAFDDRQVMLVEADAHVLRRPVPEALSPGAPEPSSTTMLRYLDTIEETAHLRPILIVLDDLQWADADSLRAARFLARNLRSASVTLLATLRTEEERADPAEGQSLRETLEGMEHDGTLRRLPLSGLAEDEAQQMARALFGLPLGLGEEDDSFRALFRRSGGNPFFLQETLRQLAAEGHLRRDGGRLGVNVLAKADGSRRDGPPALPDTLRRLVSRRLQGITKEGREMLEWGADAGSEFDLPPIAAALGRDTTDVERALERLQDEQGLVGRGLGGGEGWSFSHPLLWEVLLAEQPEPELRERSLRLADWWGSSRPQEEGTVARLYHDAHNAERGLPWVRKALERAIMAQGPETVERYHRWLQEMLELSGVSVDTRVREGLEVALRLGRASGSSRPLLRIYEGLLALRPSDEIRWEVGARCVSTLVNIDPGEGGKRLDALQLEVEGIPGGPPPKVRLAILQSRSLLGLFAHDHAASLASAEDALHWAGVAGDDWDRAWALYCGGWALSQLGRRAELGTWLTKLRAVTERTGWARLEGMQASLGAQMAWSAGDLAMARLGWKDVLEATRRTGDHRTACSAMVNLGFVLLLAGETEEAMSVAREARRLAERFDLPTQVGATLHMMGEALLRERRTNEARASLEEALTTFARLDYHEQESSCRLILAEALLVEGAPREALSELERAASGAGGSEGPQARQGLPLLRSWLHEALGEAAEARRRLDEALQVSKEAGDALAEAQVKASLARWELAHGDPSRGSVLRTEADALFDRCGVVPDGWIRDWPPEAVDPGTRPPRARDPSMEHDEPPQTRRVP